MANKLSDAESDEDEQNPKKKKQQKKSESVSAGPLTTVKRKTDSIKRGKRRLSELELEKGGHTVRDTSKRLRRNSIQKRYSLFTSMYWRVIF
jgi:hypothetical protein